MTAIEKGFLFEFVRLYYLSNFYYSPLTKDFSRTMINVYQRKADSAGAGKHLPAKVVQNLPTDPVKRFLLYIIQMTVFFHK